MECSPFCSLKILPPKMATFYSLSTVRGVSHLICSGFNFALNSIIVPRKHQQCPMMSQLNPLPFPCPFPAQSWPPENPSSNINHHSNQAAWEGRRSYFVKNHTHCRTNYKWITQKRTTHTNTHTRLLKNNAKIFTQPKAQPSSNPPLMISLDKSQYTD